MEYTLRERTQYSVIFITVGTGRTQVEIQFIFGLQRDSPCEFDSVLEVPNRIENKRNMCNFFVLLEVF